MEYRRFNAVLPALGKMDPRWLRIGEHRDLRKRVLASFRLKDTISVIELECYGPYAEPKYSLDQDTNGEWRRAADAGRPGHNGGRVGESILATGMSQNLS